MARFRMWPGILLGCFVLLGFYAGRAPTLFAQAGSSAKPSDAKSPEAGQNLTEQQMRGEKLFMQSCSICHLGRKMKNGNPPTVAPDLAGLFKAAKPEEEKALREHIMVGTPLMPGFQYKLNAKDLDDLVAFLKTL